MDDFWESPPRREVKAAWNVDEIPDAFDATALTSQKEMNDFYVATMDARTGNPDKSPIAAIERACHRPRERGAMLLLGHRGCGKSTELNDMKLRLKAEGRPVMIIECEERLPLENRPRFSDLLVLMGDALYKMAVKLDVSIPPDTLERIHKFWNIGKRVTETSRSEEISIDAELKVGTPAWLKAVLNELFVKLNSDLKFNDNVRKEWEERIENHYADWRMILRSLADGISAKSNHRQPVLIFEGLDHLENLEEARELFFSQAGKLADVSFPVIYTFPIALYYDKGFDTFGYLFRRCEVFPMLKLETIDGKPYLEGPERLRAIVQKRLRADLIEPDALELMIAKTGGSLRDLFQAIREAGETASYRGYRTGSKNEKITRKDAESALKEVQSSLTRRIEGDEHKFLARICMGNRREIEKSQMLLDMLQTRAVLEYNGERWFNVHPLVADYLEELRYVKRKDDDSGWEAGERMTDTETV